MNTEKIKRIAEGVYPERTLGENKITGAIWTCDNADNHSYLFNPYESDADAFKVLEAGIKEFGIVNFYTLIAGIYTSAITGDCLKTAICEAYLATRGKT